MRKQWWLAGLCLGAILLGIWFILGLQRIDWIGSTDLEVEFVVTDGTTGQPVQGAWIAVHSEGGRYRESEEKEFTLLTDQDGMARRLCHDTFCSGVAGGTPYKNTFHVYLPYWQFLVSAPGYEPSALLYLHAPEYSSLVQRVAPGQSRLVVSVSLQKKHA